MMLPCPVHHSSNASQQHSCTHWRGKMVQKEVLIRPTTILCSTIIISKLQYLSICSEYNTCWFFSQPTRQIPSTHLLFKSLFLRKKLLLCYMPCVKHMIWLTGMGMKRYTSYAKGCMLVLCPLREITLQELQKLVTIECYQGGCVV